MALDRRDVRASGLRYAVLGFGLGLGSDGMVNPPCPSLSLPAVRPVLNGGDDDEGVGEVTVGAGEEGRGKRASHD